MGCGVDLCFFVWVSFLLVVQVASVLFLLLLVFYYYASKDAKK